VDQSTWRTKNIRVYDPIPNPNQCHGECTGVASVIAFNAAGNRKRGVVLGMDDAHRIYSGATTLDPWDGSWPPTDTGSSGLAAAKSAQAQGYGGAYHWIMSGIDGVVQAIIDGAVVSIGTRWDNNMFDPDSDGRVHLGGPVVGGHQWVARGYDAERDWLKCRCWWGGFRDFYLARTDAGELLADAGDAHVQERAA
jgi:hypothetical protein